MPLHLVSHMHANLDQITYINGEFIQSIHFKVTYKRLVLNSNSNIFTHSRESLHCSVPMGCIVFIFSILDCMLLITVLDQGLTICSLTAEKPHPLHNMTHTFQYTQPLLSYNIITSHTVQHGSKKTFVQHQV